MGGQGTASGVAVRASSRQRAVRAARLPLKVPAQRLPPSSAPQWAGVAAPEARRRVGRDGVRREDRAARAPRREVVAAVEVHRVGAGPHAVPEEAVVLLPQPALVRGDRRARRVVGHLPRDEQRVGRLGPVAGARCCHRDCEQQQQPAVLPPPGHAGAVAAASRASPAGARVALRRAAPAARWSASGAGGKRVLRVLRVVVVVLLLGVATLPLRLRARIVRAAADRPAAIRSARGRHVALSPRRYGRDRCGASAQVEPPHDPASSCPGAVLPRRR